VKIQNQLKMKKPDILILIFSSFMFSISYLISFLIKKVLIKYQYQSLILLFILSIPSIFIFVGGYYYIRRGYKNETIICIIEYFFVLSIFVYPILLGFVENLQSSIKFIQTVNYAMEIKGLNPSTTKFHNFPLIYIPFIILSLLRVKKIPIFFILYYPAIYNLILVFLIRKIIGKITTQRGITYIICTSFIAANWINQDFFNQQSVGYLIFLLVIYLYINLIENKDNIFANKKTLKLLLIMILLNFCLLFTHLLSSIAASFITLYSILYYSFNFRKKMLNKKNTECLEKQGKQKKFLIILLIVSLFLISIFIFIFLKYTRILFIIKLISANLFDLKGSLIKNIYERLLGSTYRSVIQIIRILTVLITYTFLIFEIILHRKNLNKHFLILPFIFWILPFIHAYGGEMFMRSYLFSLPGIMIFLGNISNIPHQNSIIIKRIIKNKYLHKVSKKLYNNKYIIYGILIISSTTITHFGNLPICIFNNNEILALSYINDNYDTAIVIGAKESKGFFEIKENLGQIKHLAIWDIKWDYISDWFNISSMQNYMEKYSNLLFIKSQNDLFYGHFYGYNLTEITHISERIESAPESIAIFHVEEVYVFKVNLY